MKAAFIALAAVPLLLSANAASAQSAPAKRWLDAAAAEIGARAQAAPAAGTVTLRARIDGSKRFDSVDVVGASGSPSLDRAVLDAARERLAETPPAELVGRTVLLRVTPVSALAEAGRGAVSPR